MVQPIQGAGSAQHIDAPVTTGSAQQTARSGNINMTTPKSDKYIETEHYIQARIEICSQNPELRRVFENVEYTINQDGSVHFTFKNNVNVEQFKQAFGLADGLMRAYLKNRHNEGMNNQSVHAVYTNGATSDHEEYTNYELGGLGATIRFTDGYAMKKQHRGGWINKDKIVDCPDYRGMTLGPDDNERLFNFDKSCFNYQ